MSFGKYKLIDRIAVGGMADIFKAKTSGMGGFEKILVIKRLHDRLSEDDEFIEMMVDEAKIAVRLNHPNIGKIFDLGCINRKYFIAMEYIEGPDISRLLRWSDQRAKSLPIPVTLHIASEVCAGLHYAHTRKDAEGQPMHIVHRDVSPPNIMLSVEGEVKVVDFGIAKARKRVQDTRHGIIKGKFHYMAPEQAHGRRVDARTDVFSIGMVLYEMLAGANPYDGVEESELLRTVRMAQIPPVREHRPALDPELDRIVMRALERNPKNRWSSAADLEKALRDYRDRKCEPFDRRRMSDWVRPVWKEVTEEGTDRVERTSLMTEFEYEASDASVIFEAPDEQQSQGGAGNPFDEDAPTEVWEGGPGGYSGPSSGGGQEPPGRSQTGGPDSRRSSGGTPAVAGNTLKGQGPTPPSPKATGQGQSGRGAQNGQTGQTGRQNQPGRPPGPPSRSGGGGSASRKSNSEPDFGNAPPPPDENAGDFFSGRPARETSTPSGPTFDGSGRGPGRERATPTGNGRGRGGQGDGDNSLVAPLVSFSKNLEEAGVDLKMQRYAGLAAIVALLLGVGIGMIALGSGGGTKADESRASGTSVGGDRKGAAQAGPEMVTLPVSSIPRGAEIAVNGQPKGTTPQSLSALEVGREYTLEFSRQGFETVTETIVPSADSKPIVVELAKTDGVLRVMTFPSDARIEVNGRIEGYSPVTVTDLRRDETHEVVATLEDDKKVRRSVSWAEEDGSVKRVRIRFDDAEEEADRERRAERRPTPRRRRVQRPRRRQPSPSANSGSDRGSPNSGGGSNDQEDSQGEEPDLFAGGGGGSTSGSSGGGGGGSNPSSGSEESGSESSGGGGGGSEEKATDLDIWSLGNGGGGSGGSGGGAQQAAKGTLTVKVSSGWGKVYVDGKLVTSKSPLLKHQLGDGAYKVKVYYPVLKRFSEEKTVHIASGTNATVVFSP